MKLFRFEKEDCISMKSEIIFGIENNKHLLIDVFILIILNLSFSLILFLYNWPPIWPHPGFDSEAYAQMAKGINVGYPYSNRVLVPILISFLPNDLHMWGFLFFTVLGLLVSDLFLYLIMRKQQFSRQVSIIGSIIWMGSNAYTWHFYDFGFIDPIYFAFITAFFYFLEDDHPYLVIPILWLGFFVKEAMMFFISFIFIKYLFNRRSHNLMIGFIAGTPLVIITLLRMTGETHYSVQSIVNILHNVGIPLDQGLIISIFVLTRLLFALIFMIYGIILPLAIIGFFQSSNERRLQLILISFITSITLLFANNWFRMLYILFPILIPLGMRPLGVLSIQNIKSIIEFDLIIGISIIIWFLCPFVGSCPRYIIFFFLGLILALAYLLRWRKNSKLISNNSSG